jgi:hypothetical protein
MEHILLRCESNHRTKIWELSKKAWPASHGEWPEITMGIVLACNSITLKPAPTGEDEPTREATKETKGCSRLMQELIQESVYLIWGMRCERAVGDRETEHSENEVTKRWEDRMVERFSTDRALVLRAGKPMRRIKTLRAKWDGVANVLQALDMVQEPVHLLGFLVGTEHLPHQREAEPEPHTTGLLDPK